MEQKDVQQVRDRPLSFRAHCNRNIDINIQDHVQVAALVKNYLKRFSLAPIFSKEEIAHWFLPRDDVINSYVVEEKGSGKITDFLSFYSLPSTIIGNPTYKTLRYLGILTLAAAQSL